MTRSARGTLDERGVRIALKKRLNRSILKQGWGELRRQLQYKTVWDGLRLVEVPAQHSSQTCSACGVVHPKSRESQARFRCVTCGHVEHADINAAWVILARAVTGQEDGRRIGASQRGEPSRRRPGPRTANSLRRVA